ncbi:high-affinity iron permease [Irineochytrium annulatum]|nr:high-affinity iron permease [Irineochytrium annulatum]
MFGFSIPIYFVLFREATEAAIVVSVLITFITSAFRDRKDIRTVLMRQVWFGTVAGIIVSLAIGAAFIVVWFKYASNLWNSAEPLWEGIFSLIASLLMTIMAIAFLKSDQLTAKWHRKLNKALAKTDEFGHVIKNTDEGAGMIDENNKKVTIGDDVEVVQSPANPAAVEADDESDGSNTAVDAESVAARKTGGGSKALFIIPFVTVLREGLEAMVFLGGITISADPGTIPLAAAAGILSGLLIGYIIYRAGNSVKLHMFFVCSSIFLLFLSAGLAAKAAVKFEQRDWALHVGIGDTDAASTYNPLRAVWYTSCCNPGDPNAGGWQLFAAIFGWSNSAMYSSVGTYIAYWIVVSLILVATKLGAFNGVKKAKASAKAKMAGVFNK